MIPAPCQHKIGYNYPVLHFKIETLLLFQKLIQSRFLPLILANSSLYQIQFSEDFILNTIIYHIITNDKKSKGNSETAKIIKERLT